MTDLPASQNGELAKLKRLAWLLDNALPLPGGYRIGIDSLLGLVPGVGDSAGLIASAYIVWRANLMRIPTPVLAKMIGNIAIDAVLGVVPLLGDIFDIAYKANLRNVELIESELTGSAVQHAPTPGMGRRALLITITILLVAGVIFGFILLVVVVFAATIEWLQNTLL